MSITKYSKDHVRDIYNNLNQKEAAICIDYMEYQGEITKDMRSTVCDWLIKLHHNFNTSTQTLHLAVRLVDRYLSKKKVPRCQYQLVAATSLYISSKYEDVYYPTTSKLLHLCDNLYILSDFISKERQILETVEYEVGLPTAHEFMELLLFGNLDEQDIIDIKDMSTYLCELSLINYEFIFYKPSIVAASSIFLTLKTLGAPGKSTEFLSEFKEDPKFQECTQSLHQCHIDSNKGIDLYKSINKRYQSISKVKPVGDTKDFFK